MLSSILKERFLFIGLGAAILFVLSCGPLTHYATGTSPVIFGSGYTTLGEWWKTGFVMSVLLIVIWLVVGGAWWRLLGYW